MDADAAKEGPGLAVIQSPTNASEEAPPSYDCIVDSQLPAEPPPTYDSLFGNIQRTRKESNGCLDFLKNLLILLLSTVGCVIFLALLLAIPITCIILGARYKAIAQFSRKYPYTSLCWDHSECFETSLVCLIRAKRDCKMLRMVRRRGVTRKSQHLKGRSISSL